MLALRLARTHPQGMNKHKPTHHDDKRHHEAASEVTSPKVASAAAKLLQDPEASPEAKSVAASALTQAPDKPKATPFEQVALALPCSGCDGQLKLVDKVSGLCMKHHPLT